MGQRFLGDQSNDNTTMPSYLEVLSPPTAPKATSADPAWEIYYLDYSTEPPEGWGITKSAYTGYYAYYFRIRGEGEIDLASSQGGNSLSKVSSFGLILKR